MKTKFVTLLLILGSTSAFAQGPWFTNGNAIGPANFLGTNNNQPLRFVTNGQQRMLIWQGGSSTASGRIAMGNDLPNNFVPQSRLHLHQTKGTVDLRFTNGFTGSGGLNGYQIRINKIGRVNHIQWTNSQPLIFYMGGINNGNEYFRLSDALQDRIWAFRNTSTFNYLPPAQVGNAKFVANTPSCCFKK